MIPYITIPPLVLWKLEFHAFGVLVGIAILVGAWLAAARAEELKLSRAKMNDMVLWLLAVGFILAHLVAVFFYHPHRLREDPWVLLQFWNGISSIGGFFGGILGFWIYTQRQRLPRMAYADATAYALSFAWIFGRAGCSVAHDHPGMRSDSFFAVAYPEGPRFDLGLYEFVWAIVVSAILFALRKKAAREAPGLITATLALLYAPVRFLLDFLRATDLGQRSDPRLLGLTAAQYGCIVIFALGVAILAWRKRQPPWDEYLRRAGVLGPASPEATDVAPDAR